MAAFQSNVQNIFSTMESQALLSWLTSPGGRSDLHIHWAFATEAHLVRPGNGVISGQLQGKSSTRLSDMQIRKKSCRPQPASSQSKPWLAQTDLLWKEDWGSDLLLTQHDKIWKMNLTNELWCKYLLRAEVSWVTPRHLLSPSAQPPDLLLSRALTVVSFKLRLMHK